MNFADTKRKIDRAIGAESALLWLRPYAPKSADVDREQINATININYSSACAGVKEARQYLEDAAQFYMAEIGRYATALAEKDLAIGTAVAQAAASNEATEAKQ